MSMEVYLQSDALPFIRNDLEFLEGKLTVLHMYSVHKFINLARICGKTLLLPSVKLFFH